MNCMCARRVVMLQPLLDCVSLVNIIKSSPFAYICLFGFAFPRLHCHFSFLFVNNLLGTAALFSYFFFEKYATHILLK